MTGLGVKPEKKWTREQHDVDVRVDYQACSVLAGELWVEAQAQSNKKLGRPGQISNGNIDEERLNGHGVSMAV